MSDDPTRHNDRHPGWGKLIDDLTFNLGVIGLMAAAMVLLYWRTSEFRRRALLLGFGVILCLAASNQVHDHFVPILAVVAGIALYTPSQACGAPVWDWRRLAAAAVTLISAGPVLLLDSQAILFHRYAAGNPELATPDSRRRDLAWLGSPEVSAVAELQAGRMGVEAYREKRLVMIGTDFRLFLDEGLALADRVDPERGKTVALTQTGFIAVAGDRPPAHGGALWFDYGRTFTERTFPRIPHALLDADLVLVPKISAERRFLSTAKLTELNLPHLEAHFIRCAETALWQAWLRMEKNCSRT